MPTQEVSGFRLSPQQHHLWQHQQDGAVKLAQVALLLEGALEVNALKAALQQAVDRHAVYRTTLAHLPGMKAPVMVVADRGTFGWHEVEVRDWEDVTDVTPAQLEDLLTRENAGSFNFEHGPLLQATLCKLAADKHVLHLRVPSLFADRWTLNHLFHEISNAYAASRQGQVYEGEVVQYLQFSEWQHQLLAEDDEDAEAGKAYWQQQDWSALATLKLPFSVAGTTQSEPRSRRFSVPLNPEIGAQLTALAQQFNTSRAVCLQSCWQLLLWRLTGEQNPIVGWVSDGREYEELYEVCGLLAKTLPIQLPLTADLCFTEVLSETAAAIEEAREWQAYFNWEEQLGGVGLPFGFEWVELPAPAIAAETRFSIIEQSVDSDRFSLKLTGKQTASALVAEFEADLNHFSAEAVAYVADLFQTLLASAIAQPDCPIGKLNLLSASARHQLLVEFNPTQAEYPQPDCLHQLFEQQVQRTPANLAVVFETEQLTYGQLNARANQLAHSLQQLGVGAEKIVGIYLERSIEMAVSLLGVLKAGGAYLPLDPNWPRERIANILATAQPTAMITDSAGREKRPPTTAPLVVLDQPHSELAQMSVDNPKSTTKSDNLAYVLFTSGSTGQPKGVCIEHRQVFNYVHAIIDRLQLSPVTNFALVSTFTADLGNTAIFPTLCTGGCLHIISPERATNAAAMAEYGRCHQIDALKIVPSHLAALLRAPSPQDLLPRKRLILGGEPLTWQLVEEIERYAPECQIFNHYGPTEATVGAVADRVMPGERTSHNVPIGRPLANVQIYLLDESLQPVPIGMPGEIYIGGAGVARGYLNQPSLTQEKFVPSPFDAQGRLYKTGDLARYQFNGNLEFLGRIDRQVKIRGFRLELGEIEAVLSQHLAIAQAAVVARENEAGNRRLVAYFVPRDRTPTPKELREFLQQHLPDYMVPADFVPLDALPLTANGKVDWHNLPAPKTTPDGGCHSFVAPRTPRERDLAEIWCQVLGRSQVGIHDNFFELGGDSILSIQVVARANQAGLPIVPKHLFQYQTIAELASITPEEANQRAEQGLVKGTVPLTPIQHWFFEQNFPAPHHWNQALLLQVPPSLNRQLLEQAWQHLIAHHDALRLRFVQTSSGWQQVHGEAIEVPPVIERDLSPLPLAAQTTEIEATANELQGSLDLESGPLVRVALFHLGADQPSRLLVIIHHLIVDGVSWRILLADLQSAIAQLQRQETIQLPPKTTAFQQWSQQLQVYARSHTLQSEIDYWVSLPPADLAPLPVDFPEGRNTVEVADTVSVALSLAETEALLQALPALYHSQINELLLAALVQALRQWTGEASYWLDLEGHGREELFADLNLARTVGWFTTHFPVCFTVEPQATFAEILREVKTSLRRLPKRGIGYGILRYLCGDRAITEQLQALPPAEIKFNYLGQLDRLFSDASGWQFVSESCGLERSPRAHRSHLLEINGMVTGGQLRLDWIYSTQIHQRATIERLARGLIAALKSAIAQGQSEGLRALTPADFPLANLDRESLVTLLQTHPAIEDIYCLSPMQQGMLFDSLSNRQSGLYFQQTVCTLHGNLNIAGCEQAWQQIVDRHPILRTAFFWEGLSAPVQVVLRQAKLPFEYLDWRNYPATEQQIQLANFLESNRDRGFTLSQAPLMRLTLIRVEEEVYQLIWSRHHLLLDGWSLPIVFEEFLTLYEADQHGQTPALTPPRPYRDYIAWLHEQDSSDAESFWRQRLAGFKAPTPLTLLRSPRQTATNSGSGEESLLISEAMTTALQEFTRRHQLTLNTVLHGIWALILGSCSQQDQVVFGSPVSGRPPTLPGVESMVGMFMNTLPVRVQLSSNLPCLSWLKTLQTRHSEALQYQHSSLVDIHGWSEVPRDQPLFHSIFVFENYPISASLRSRRANLRLGTVRQVEKSNYPLNVMAIPGEQLSLRILYQDSLFQPGIIGQVLGLFETAIERILSQPNAPLKSIQDDFVDAIAQQQQCLEEEKLQTANRQKLEGLKQRMRNRTSGSPRLQ